MKRLYLCAGTASDFRVLRLELKLRRTLVVGGGTRQDRYEPKLANFESPQECGICTRFVATRAPYGPGCHTAPGVRGARQNVSGATDRSRIVAAGSRFAAVHLSGRAADGGIDSDFKFLDCSAYCDQQEVGNLQQLCACETRQHF